MVQVCRRHRLHMTLHGYHFCCLNFQLRLATRRYRCERDEACVTDPPSVSVQSRAVTATYGMASFQVNWLYSTICMNLVTQTSNDVISTGIASTDAAACFHDLLSLHRGRAAWRRRRRSSKVAPLTAAGGGGTSPSSRRRRRTRRAKGKVRQKTER